MHIHLPKNQLLILAALVAAEENETHPLGVSGVDLAERTGDLVAQTSRYDALRGLEFEGLVTSQWDTEASASSHPVRRHKVTDLGKRALEDEKNLIGA